ncbi:sulfatase [Planctomycetaceae bacterium SCGC AG-212-F19]|nr:sulfatase [Planctomycetaceae bacterium SCGC AG-212-F19]
MLAALLGGVATGRAEQPAVKPNIVFILADDLGINDLGCYGRKEHPTPHIDRLATQGARFTSAYAEPVCSPTRAALMTGKWPARLHLTTFLPGRPDAPSQKVLHPKINQQLPKEEKTIADLLKDAGYQSACIGKWHLGGKGSLPQDRGFDFVYTAKANTAPSDAEGGKGEYELTRQAEKFITDNKDRPFFLYLAHNTPHIPLGAKPDLVAKYKDAFNPTYAAMMHTLDDCVGRILAKLDELKLADRTLVVFTSDNGGLHVPEMTNTPATHNTPYRAGKGFLYEGGLRIPLIVRWPGQVPAGCVIDSPVQSMDWVPTFLELAGAKPSAPLDGMSLAGLLRGKEFAARPLFWHFPHYTNQGGRPGGAIRDGDWKLIEHYEDGQLELFNLAKDPTETKDLADDEPDMAKRLHIKLDAWRKLVGAQEMTPNPNFDPARHKKLYIDTDVSTLKPAATAAEMRPKLEAWREEMQAVVKPPAKPKP